jgi:hypothetical protein
MTSIALAAAWLMPKGTSRVKLFVRRHKSETQRPQHEIISIADFSVELFVVPHIRPNHARARLCQAGAPA